MLAGQPRVSQVLPVFYINLAHRTDRRAFMERQFAALGIAAERLEAVTPATLDPYWRDLAAGPVGRGRVSPPELACSLSHRRIWQIVAERGLPAAIVLEDDMQLSSGFAALAAATWSDATKPDILRLETQGRPALLGRATADPVPARQIFSPDAGAGGYVIAGKAAGALADHPLLAEFAVDKFLFGREGPCFYAHALYHAVPALCRPDDDVEHAQSVLQSDIQSVRSERRRTRKPKTIAIRLERVGRNLAHAAASIGNIARRGALFSLERRLVPFLDGGEA